MERRALACVTLVLMVFGCVVPAALAEDEAEKDAKAAELLRLGRVAETVDRDLSAARKYYTRALSSAKTAEVGIEAGLSLARLMERKGERSRAVSTLRRLENRWPLTPEQRQALDAMVRHLTPASVADAPDASPLERKIREMFANYARTPANARPAERAVVWGGVAAVGKEALPTLESIVMEGGPSVASLAAELYADIGRADAVEGLERMIVDGDRLIRPSVVRALGRVRPGETTSPRLIPMLDRLLARDDLGEQRAAVRSKLLEHLDVEDLLPRHLAGGPDAVFWLDEALKQRADGAVDRALVLIKERGEAGRSALNTLLPLFIPSRQTGVAVYPVETLGVEAAWHALALLTEDPFRNRNLASLVQVARLIESVGGEEAGVAARTRAWRVLLDAGSRHPADFVNLLLYRRFLPPLELLEDPDFAVAFWTGLTQMHANSATPVRALESMVDWGSRFWEAVFGVIPRLGAEHARRLLAWLGSALRERPLPPAEHDRRWFTVLEQAAYGAETEFPPDFLYRAMARSGDERFLTALRRQTIDREWDRYNRAALRALADYTGPGRLDFVKEALADPKVDSSSTSTLLDVLSTDDDAESRSLLVSIASDPGHPHAIPALQELDDIRAEEAVLAIARRAQEVPGAYPRHYRNYLIFALRTLHLREGIPYLLYEYERGELAKAAAEAMDAIRDYHDRLRTFEAFGERRDEEREEEIRRLVDLLRDEDPEIRRAAILALAAMKRTDALPRIVALAKEDPDERVREAALRAVEQMAR